MTQHTSTYNFVKSHIITRFYLNIFLANSTATRKGLLSCTCYILKVCAVIKRTIIKLKIDLIDQHCLKYNNNFIFSYIFNLFSYSTIILRKKFTPFLPLKNLGITKIFTMHST